MLMTATVGKFMSRLKVDHPVLSLAASLFLFYAVTGNALEPLADRPVTGSLGPEVMNPDEAGIGRLIRDVAFESVYGGKETLHAVLGDLGTVVVVRDPECPVSLRYGPRVSRLASHYQQQGFAFVFIYLNESLGPTTLAEDVGSLAAPAVYVGKGSHELGAELGVQSTGDVFLLDHAGQLVFRGAVDDQYGFGYTRDLPTRNYLRNALDAVLENRAIEIPAVTAPGCVIDADPRKDQLFQALPPGGALS